MAEPWLSIIGLGEDGLIGLTSASRAALDDADIVFGARRHLALVEAGARGQEWPVPFSISPVLALRGQRVAVLASGDPFWHGVGGSLANHLSATEWRAFPQASIFSLAAARLGWRIEETLCIGLHAAPFGRLVGHLSRGLAAICLVRDGLAAAELAVWLRARGFGQSRFWLLEALGGPRERITEGEVHSFVVTDARTPVAVAFVADGGTGLQRAAGLPNDTFKHDGQISKRPIRALTLSALAPRPGEVLWDVGAGSGAIAIEWVLFGRGDSAAIAIEEREERAENIRNNANELGVDDRISVVVGKAPAALAGLPEPQAIFLGGGADEAMLQALWAVLPPDARLVANAVTLETESLLSRWSSEKGGKLLRIELAEDEPLGRFRSWVPARPIVQWSVTR